MCTISMAYVVSIVYHTACWCKVQGVLHNCVVHRGEKCNFTRGEPNNQKAASPRKRPARQNINANKSRARIKMAKLTRSPKSLSRRKRCGGCATNRLDAHYSDRIGDPWSGFKSKPTSREDFCRCIASRRNSI